MISGIGTALKISFNLKKLFKNPESLFLRRSEIVALYNTYGRLSHSIIAVAKFRERFKSGLYSRKKTESSNRSFPNLMKNLSSARSRIFVFSMAFTILVIIAHLLICFFLRRKKPKAVNK